MQCIFKYSSFLVARRRYVDYNNWILFPGKFCPLKMHSHTCIEFDIVFLYKLWLHWCGVMMIYTTHNEKKNQQRVCVFSPSKFSLDLNRCWMWYTRLLSVLHHENLFLLNICSTNVVKFKLIMGLWLQWIIYHCMWSECIWVCLIKQCNNTSKW